MNLLLTDDDVAVCDATETLLNACEYPVNIAKTYSGKEAIKKFEKQVPDVVVIDMEMPGLDGLETSRKLRSISHDVYIIAFTNFENKYRILAEDGLIDQWISKMSFIKDSSRFQQVIKLFNYSLVEAAIAKVQRDLSLRSKDQIYNVLLRNSPQITNTTDKLSQPLEEPFMSADDLVRMTTRSTFMQFVELYKSSPDLFNRVYALLSREHQSNSKVIEALKEIDISGLADDYNNDLKLMQDLIKNG